MTAELYPEHRGAWHAAHYYGLRCLAHRLRKFGWEPCVGTLDARSLRILATMVHEPLASACRREAVASV